MFCTSSFSAAAAVPQAGDESSGSATERPWSDSLPRISVTSIASEDVPPPPPPRQHRRAPPPPVPPPEDSDSDEGGDGGAVGIGATAAAYGQAIARAASVEGMAAAAAVDGDPLVAVVPPGFDEDGAESEPWSDPETVTAPGDGGPIRMVMPRPAVEGTTEVHLRRDGPQFGFGMQITEDEASGYARVELLVEGEPAARSGAVAIGDRVVAVNGVPMGGKSLEAVTAALQDADSVDLMLEQDAAAFSGDGDVRTVHLRRDGPQFGFGMQITEDEASGYARVELLVEGEPAARSGAVAIGDRVVAVNGVPMGGKSLEAVTAALQDADSVDLMLEQDARPFSEDDTALPVSAKMPPPAERGDVESQGGPRVTVTISRPSLTVQWGLQVGSVGEEGGYVRVVAVAPGSVAACCGQIQVGDRILGANGVWMKAFSASAVERLMIAADALVLVLERDSSPLGSSIGRPAEPGLLDMPCAPAQPSEHFARAAAALDMGQLRQAEQSAVGGLYADPADVNCRVLLGLVAFRDGDRVSAAEIFAEALVTCPSDGNALVYLAGMKAKSEPARAAALYRQALLHHPRCETAMLELARLLGTGTMELGADAVAESERLYRQLLIERPKDPDLLAELGMVMWLQMGNAQLAERYLRQALEVHPGHAAAANGLQVLEAQCAAAGNALQSTGGYDSGGSVESWSDASLTLGRQSGRPVSSVPSARPERQCSPLHAPPFRPRRLMQPGLQAGTWLMLSDPQARTWQSAHPAQRSARASTSPRRRAAS